MIGDTILLSYLTEVEIKVFGMWNKKPKYILNLDKIKLKYYIKYIKSKVLLFLYLTDEVSHGLFDPWYPISSLPLINKSLKTTLYSEMSELKENKTQNTRQNIHSKYFQFTTNQHC